MAVFHDMAQNGPSPSLGGGVLRAAGALAALGAVGAVAWWGVTLMTRDTSTIPVVRAQQEILREEPANPGGAVAPHMGQSVTAVAASGKAAEPAGSYVRAPLDTGLAPEDQPVAELKQVAAATAADPTESDVVQSMANGIVQATAGGQLRDVSADPGLSVRQTGAADAQASAADVVDGGVGRSLRPRPRPETIIAVSRNSVPAVATAAALAAPRQSAEVAPTEVALGETVVQFGAYNSPTVAREQWGVIAQRFPGLMSDKQRLVAQTLAEGRTLYRLRAVGFDGYQEAKQFCAAIQAGGKECIAVINR